MDGASDGREESSHLRKSGNLVLCMCFLCGWEGEETDKGRVGVEAAMGEGRGFCVFCACLPASLLARDEMT